MKNAFFIVLALLAGLVIGNFSTKSDLRKAQQDVASLQEQLNTRGRRQGNFQNVAALLRVPVAPQPAKPRRGPHAGDEVDGEDEAAPPKAAAPKDEAAERKKFEEQIQKALDLWKTRSELARNSFLSNINATDAQKQAFDQVENNMNRELGLKIKDWAEFLKKPQAGSPETALRMMDDLGRTIIASYDDLDHSLPADWRDKAGPKFQMFDFINPEVALPLANVKDVFEGARRKP